MKHLKAQAEQLYVELFGPILVPRPDYISQVIHLMGLIRHGEQIQASNEQEVKRGRKASNTSGT